MTVLDANKSFLRGYTDEQGNLHLFDESGVELTPGGEGQMVPT